MGDDGVWWEMMACGGRRYPTILFTTTTSRGFLPLDFCLWGINLISFCGVFEGGKWWPRYCNIAVEKGQGVLSQGGAPSLGRGSSAQPIDNVEQSDNMDTHGLDPPAWAKEGQQKA